MGHVMDPGWGFVQIVGPRLGSMESFSTQVEAVVLGRVRVLPQDKFFRNCTEKNPFLKTGFHRINLSENLQRKGI